MTRIEKKFQELKEEGRKAFVAFITCGDPDLKTTQDLVLKFEKIGVDIVELGVPFSDPLADGPTIQASSERALKNRVNLIKVLGCVKRLRQKTQMPLCLLSYFNPLFRFGLKRFIREAKNSGVDGLMIPDLPPEEAGDLIPQARRYDLDTVFFLSPTSTLDRIKLISRLSRGFIYYVSLTGTTGARKRLSQDLIKNIALIKSFSSKPVCVGFGISKARQVKAVTKIADGAIVGSAIIKRIELNRGRRDLVKRVAKFTERLIRPIKHR